MSRPSYDAVVVGARCAGTPLAARLAQQGWEVLLVDREPPPADTLSTHFLFPNTVVRLRQLGALQRIEAGHRVNPLRYAVRMLGVEFSTPFTPVGGFDWMCGITRPVLDLALLEVALEAGAETRFGERVAGLLGTGSAEDPTHGIVLEGGKEIEARWVIGADGRASTVASRLGLEKERRMAGDMAFMWAYWRGLPPSERFLLDVGERANLTWAPCEDDLALVLVGVEPELTHGDAEQRQRHYVESLGQFPESFDVAWLEAAEQSSPVRIAPEPMLRGFFRRAAGPGWALIGDAGHFKHPSTAQGIADAIEQSLHVAEELLGPEQSLDGYEAWREERAREHYEWSFDYARFPTPGVTRPLFVGLASEPDAVRDFFDSFSRRTRPRSDVLTEERLSRWLAPAPAKAIR